MIIGLLNQTPLSNSVCIKMQVNDFEISINLDDSLQKTNRLFRGDIRIYKGENINDDITCDLFRTKDTIIASSENLVQAIALCNEWIDIENRFPPTTDVPVDIITKDGVVRDVVLDSSYNFFSSLNNNERYSIYNVDISEYFVTHWSPIEE